MFQGEANLSRSSEIGAGALASDQDRDLVVNLLGDACADGRLALEEFSRRVERALAARTHGDLEVVKADLAAPMGEPAGREGRRSWVVAVMSQTRQRGWWRLARTTRAVALMGECVIDLRQADVEVRHSHILAVAVMGTVQVVVPEGVAVELDGLAVMGTRKLKGARARPAPGAPVVRVTAAALMGEVKVVVRGAGQGG